MALLHWLCICTVFAARQPSLGPGRGAWILEEPEDFGFSKAQLELRARRVQAAGPVRYCFLMAVDGHFLHESYFHNSSDSRYEADSLAKTMIAEVVGVAVAQGLVDIDKPLADYGVEPRCWIDEGPYTIASRKQLHGRRKRPRQLDGTCSDLLRRLCPDVAPPFDCAGPRWDSSARPLRAGSAQCSERCLRRRDVQDELQKSNCSERAIDWCQNPPGQDGCWKDCISGNSYWPHVTTRHLLTQSSGIGNYMPGTAFTYDSGMYIDHIAYLISKVTNESSMTWATREYVLPMGLPQDLFAYDGFTDPADGPEFSPGGGQMMTCRDHLRVAQLLLNKGRWATDNGENPSRPDRPWRQLLTEEYVESMMRPNFPEAFTGYGMLSWLNAAANEKHCCSPRWGNPTALPGNEGHLQTCAEETLFDHMIGDGMTKQTAPHDLVLGMGQSAKYLMVIPSQSLAVVTLGLSWGSSNLCPLGNVDVSGKTLPNGTVLPKGMLLNADGYDDGFVASQIWRAIGNLSRVDPEPALVQRTESTPNEKRRTGSNSSLGPSCSCTCPPDMGFGSCFQMPPSATPGDCSSVRHRSAEVCPAHGQPRQCHHPPSPVDTDCKSIRHLEGMKCELKSSCGPLPGAGVLGLPPEDPSMHFATCMCYPEVFQDGACVWDDGPCQYSPYFPPFGEQESRIVYA
eukprot:TRINITY_DN14973_c0_g1_i1.p1 TRINITY_DN14973_c0_g1~~TRINITY_DN14973_c0_g1_i1.p1  ORF type:complete len:682 (-),score=69.57 TRINITY_DN14973_c0_g1_i1:89-2134(-)